MPIAIDIGLTDHLVNFFFGQFFAQVGHHVSEFGCRDQAVSITVEYLECFY